MATVTQYTVKVYPENDGMRYVIRRKARRGNGPVIERGKIKQINELQAVLARVSPGSERGTGMAEGK